MASNELISALEDYFDDTWPIEGPVPEPRPLGESGWSSATELGLHLIGVPEEAGGSGGSLADLVDVATLCGRHAADAPLIDNAVAAWAMARAALTIDPGSVLTLAHTRDGLAVEANGTVSGTLARVPWGSTADIVVTTTTDGRTVAVRTIDAEITPGLDLAGQPHDTLTLRGAPVIGIAEGATPQTLRARHSVLRIALMAGAMHAVSELTQRYVAERVQFGKPIGAFQAVQAHIVLVAQMAVMTDSLAQRLSLDDEPQLFDVNAAQLVAAENAHSLSRAAHQAHGAIGMTREYRLQGYTRRLHAWSAELASPTALAETLGAAAIAAPSFSRLILDAT